jgi:hypothetical protein
VRARSPIGAAYDTPVNRESAYEILSGRAAATAADAPPVRAPRAPAEPATHEADEPPPTRRGRAPAGEPATAGGALSDLLWGTNKRQGMVEAMAKQAARTVGSQVGRQILRGVLGGILGGGSRRR